MTDIAMLGLAVDSRDVRGATGDLERLEHQARLTELSAKALKMAMGIAAAGVAAFGVGITGAIMRMEAMDRMVKQVDRALANSGNTARTSAREIEAWADMLENRTGRAAEEVMSVATNLASFGFGRSEFFRSLELANDMAAAWGGDLRQNLEGLARALDDPLEGMAMLSKRGIKLSDDQKAMAAAFLDANDKVAAQGVVFEALEAQVKGVAEAGFGGLSAALSQAQKAWDDAFEDIVRGTGQTGDLRDSLVSLVETLSSPQFIGAVTSFGTVVVNVLKAISEGAVNAANNLRMIGDFFASSRGDFGGMSTEGLDGKLREIGRAKLELDNLAVTTQTRLDRGDTGVFGINQGALEGQIISARNQVEALIAQETQILSILEQRKNGMPEGPAPGSMDGFGAFNPYEGMDFTTDDTRKQAEKQAEQMAEMWRQLEADIKPLISTIADPFVELQSNLDKLGAWLQNEGPAGWDTYAEGVRRANMLATSSVLGSVGQITGILSGAFQDNKLLAAANAAINTAEGVTKALAQGGMFAVPTALAIGAAGAAQIATIMSTNPGGGSKVTTPSIAGGGAGATSSAAPAAPQKTVNVTIQGDYFSPESGARFLRSIQDALGVDGLQINTSYKQA